MGSGMQTNDREPRANPSLGLRTFSKSRRAVHLVLPSPLPDNRPESAGGLGAGQ